MTRETRIEKSFAMMRKVISETTTAHQLRLLCNEIFTSFNHTYEKQRRQILELRRELRVLRKQHETE